jgi:hypothetical protein
LKFWQGKAFKSIDKIVLDVVLCHLIGLFMEETSLTIGNLPFELAQISKPARNYLKVMAASLIQYHKDLPVRDPEVFPLENDKAEDFHA